MYYAPLAPQFWGEKLRKSPPELGDLGGEIASAANQTTYVYTVAPESRLLGDLKLAISTANLPDKLKHC